jgi:hypothetical protein
MQKQRRTVFVSFGLQVWPDDHRDAVVIVRQQWKQPMPLAAVRAAAFRPPHGHRRSDLT